ncbi:MAG: amino acid ABC transporter permease [Clostridia bacterium]|nr:amino acid ABC transporter permease [Clostridia bacterium]
MDFSWIGQYYPYFIAGTVNTIVLAFFTVLFGVLIGIVVALMKISKNRLLKFVASAYIEFIRGTPLVVQISIVFYGLPVKFPEITFLGMEMERFIPGIIALSINSGAYVAEIFRAGIQAIDKGQTEAARSLGLTQAMAMRYVILPQAIRNILPALGNEFVVVIKESSIVYIIGIAELMFSSSIVRGATYRALEPLLLTAVIYFILTFTLSKFLGIAERRMRAGD